jgi:hypothetical protein
MRWYCVASLTTMAFLFECKFLSRFGSILGPLPKLVFLHQTLPSEEGLVMKLYTHVIRLTLLLRGLIKGEMQL